MSRVYLTADAMVYLASTGSDTTGDGSIGNPWATATKAYEYAKRNLDLAGQWKVIVNLKDNMSGAWIFKGDLTGAEGDDSFMIRGINTNRNCLFIGSYLIEEGAKVRIRYMAVQPDVNGNVWTVTDGVFLFGDINLNICNGGVISNAVGPRSKVRALDQCTLVGIGSCHHVFISEDRAQTELAVAMDVAGAPTWTGAFCQGDLGGMIDGTGFVNAGGGYPTGPRYTACQFGIVWTGGSGGPNFYPGSSAGNANTGFYA